ncbi:MAG: tetratricopeptide repeat protein [Brumimicrobium sp.]
MKHYILLFFYAFVFGASNLYSQDIDQITTDYLNGSVEDKMSLLFKHYSKLESIDNDTLLFFIKDLQNTGIEKDREDAIALSSYIFGHFLNNIGLYSEASQKLSSAEKYFMYDGRDSILVEIYNAKGNTAFLQGLYGKAEEFYLKSFDLGKELEDDKYKSLSLANLSRIYIINENFDEAETLLKDYIEFNKKRSNYRNVGTGYGILGQLYLNQENNEKATECLEQSMEFNLSTGDPKLIANGYTNFAIASFINGSLKRAEEYFKLALSYRLESEDYFFIAESYFNLGDYFHEVNKLDTALKYHQNSYDIALEHNNKIGVKDALFELSRIYEKLEDYKNQSKALKEYIEVKDEINSEKTSKELNVLRASFKEEHNKLNYKGNKRETMLHSKISNVSKIWDYWVLIVVIGIIILGTVVYFASNKRKN